MTVLVTGICGFAGRFLTEELAKAGHRVYGFDLPLPDGTVPEGVSDFAGGCITHAETVFNAVNRWKPDACIHLAGIASPPIGKSHPEHMLNINILGTAHILEALHRQAPGCRFLLASTAYVYGTPPEDIPIGEDAPLRPNGIYAVSKAAADLMTLAYARDFGLPGMSARTANHTGPGQSPDFVVPAFARQMAAIARGRQDPVLRVGNLDSERSFLDVRDVVRAYRLLIENGTAGQAYNIAAGKRMPIRRIVESLAELAGVAVRIEIDPDRYRPTDRTPRLNTESICRETGWTATRDWRETLREVLDDAAR